MMLPGTDMVEVVACAMCGWVVGVDYGTMGCSDVSRLCSDLLVLGDVAHDWNSSFLVLVKY